MAAQADRSFPFSTFRLVFACCAFALLAVPFIAMQFSPELNWGPGDFLMAAILLAALWAGVKLALRLSRRPMGRILGVAACALAFLTIWAELAVGILD